MNFVETMVTEKNGAVYLEADAGVSLRAEGENEMVLRRNYLGKMVILGLRPEDLQEKATAEAHGICSRENRVKAFVELREMIGAESPGKNLLLRNAPYHTIYRHSSIQYLTFVFLPPRLVRDTLYPPFRKAHHHPPVKSQLIK